MASREYTRRNLIQKGAAGAGFVALGSLAGCNGGDGNGNGNGTPTDDETEAPTDSETPTDDETETPTDSETPTDDETETPTDSGPDIEIRPGDIVPAKAEAVVSMDVQAMLNDDDLRDMGDTVLAQLREYDPQADDLPEDVDSAIEMAREEADLDPTEFQQGLLFMQVEESGADNEYVGIAMQTGWTEDELVDSIESEGNEQLQQSEYGGFTIYTSEDNEEGGLAVLSDGQYVVGTTAVLEDVIDVVNGDADPIAGELATLYDDTTAGHVAFATVVPEGTFEDEGLDVESLQAIEYMSGSVYKTDTVYGIEMNMWTGDGESAEDVVTDVESLLNAATLDPETPEQLEQIIDDIEYDTSNGTATMSYEEDIEQVKTYVENNVMSLLFLLLLGGGGTTV